MKGAEGGSRKEEEWGEQRGGAEGRGGEGWWHPILPCLMIRSISIRYEKTVVIARPHMKMHPLRRPMSHPHRPPSAIETFFPPLRIGSRTSVFSMVIDSRVIQ